MTSHTDETSRLSAVALTGASALAFEIAAARLLAPRIGNTVDAATLVVAAFLLSQALGAWLGGRIGDRVASPARVFPFVAGIGAVLLAMAPKLALAVASAGAQGGMLDSFSRPALSLLLVIAVVAIPALPLGAATPLLVSESARRRGSAERSGAFYAANAGGAVLGAAAAGFFTIERIGIAGTCFVAAGVAALASALVAFSSRGRESRPAVERAGEEKGHALPRSPSPTPRRDSWLVAAFVGGFGGIALELLALRALMQVLPNTTQSFAAVLCVFIAGLASGAALIASMCAASGAAGRPAVAAGVIPPLVAWLGAAVVAGGALPLALAGAFEIEIARTLPQQLGCALALLPGSVLSGALFAAVLLARDEPARAGTRFGAASAANALGSILGALAAGLLLLPLVGFKLATIVVAAVLAFVALSLRRDAKTLAACGVTGAALLLVSGLDLRALPPMGKNDELLAYVEGKAGNVAVVRGAGEMRPMLYINRTARQGGGGGGGGGGGERVERREGLLPALTHPGAKTALVLGVGTGATIAALLDSGVRSVAGVEIVPEVIDVLGYFKGSRGDLRDHPNVTLFRDDAVPFVAASRARFDLVVGDLFFPWQEGSGALYSLEHFEAVRRLLGDGGVFWQWIPLHQLRFEDFGRIVETFRRVFDETLLFLADPEAPFPIVALVGSAEPILLSKQRIDDRIAASPAFAAAGLDSADAVFELYFGDQHTLGAKFAAEGGRLDESRLVTFDRPQIEHLAAATIESEPVLALNNFNNLALQLGDTIGPHLEADAESTEAQRKARDLALSRRASAVRQYLVGHYWELRAKLIPDDVLGDEQREVEQYRQALIVDPGHGATRRAIERILRRRLQERRYQPAVDLGRFALRQLPTDTEIARDTGLALLLLAQSKEAVEVLESAARQESADGFLLTAYASALFLEHRDGDAAVAADRALALAGSDKNHLASAVRAATGGDRELARRELAALAEHPQWGSLARKLNDRLEG